MSECGCHAEASNEAERRILRLALGLNATMFVVGIVAGLIAQSMGLIADSLRGRVAPASKPPPHN